MNAADLTTGAAVRHACRRGEWTGPTAALAPGFAQANLVILPSEFAFEFFLFCRRNDKPCPVLAMTEPGQTGVTELADGADLRTDIPRYRVWEHGKLTGEPTEITSRWRDDLVSFLIGCSFTFDAALVSAELPVRHIEMGVNVPMYRTNIACRPAGRFRGPLVVSMRPLTPSQAETASQLTAQFPNFHGPPVHIGTPAGIGIDDVDRPDFGDPVEIRDGEVPVFWACGVTPQCALMEAKLPIAITHAPGHMLVTDQTNTTVLNRD